MAKLLDQKTALRLLRDDGWTQTVGGKHVVKMVKDGQRPITLPAHGGEAYSRGLTGAILRQAGLKTTRDGKWNSQSRRGQREMGIGRRSPSSRDASPPHER